MVSKFKTLTIFAKYSILDISKSSEYASVLKTQIFRQPNNADTRAMLCTLLLRSN